MKVYQSPIEINVEDFRQEMIREAEQTILQCIHDVGINVNREELIKALQYDRNQYAKGYADAKAEAMKLIENAEIVAGNDNLSLINQAVLLDDMFLLPADDVVEAPQWQPVSDPPKASGRYIVWCNEWGGYCMRMCDYLESEKIWLENGRNITEYVKFWTKKPEPPKDGKLGVEL